MERAQRCNCDLHLPATSQAIMLVESVDGKHALLGRPQSLRRRGPVLTCLSGFIEQGESIEEAVSDAASTIPC
jgi:NADH pyrophosphatase NudC (nudix superfamily)